MRIHTYVYDTGQSQQQFIWKKKSFRENEQQNTKTRAKTKRALTCKKKNKKKYKQKQSSNSSSKYNSYLLSLLLFLILTISINSRNYLAALKNKKKFVTGRALVYYCSLLLFPLFFNLFLSIYYLQAQSSLRDIYLLPLSYLFWCCLPHSLAQHQYSSIRGLTELSLALAKHIVYFIF